MIAFEKNQKMPDIACVAITQAETSLYFVVDLRHPLGRTDIVNDIALAVNMVGANGIWVETCPDPSVKLSVQH